MLAGVKASSMFRVLLEHGCFILLIFTLGLYDLAMRDNGLTSVQLVNDIRRRTITWYVSASSLSNPHPPPQH